MMRMLISAIVQPESPVAPDNANLWSAVHAVTCAGWTECAQQMFSHWMRMFSHRMFRSTAFRARDPRFP